MPLLGDCPAEVQLHSQTVTTTIDSYRCSHLVDCPCQNKLVLTGAIDEVGAPIRINSGSYRLGVELDLGWTISEQWQWQSNLSLSENKNRDFFFERDDQLQALGDTNLSFSPNVVGGSQLSYSLTKDLTVSLFSKYVGEQYLGNIDSALSKLAAYSTHVCCMPQALTKQSRYCQGTAPQHIC